MKRVIVPVDLGGSPTRCALSPPRDPLPTPELVSALIAHYRAERCPPGAHLEVGFFRGGLPDDALLRACGSLPIRVSCSPADLTRAEADRLRARGVTLVELEVATFADAVLRACRRGYTAGRVDAMRRGLTEQGLKVGLTLIPGLPGASHAAALEDARRAASDPPAHLTRIYPALAFEGSELARMARERRWVPMGLGAAVTAVVAMVDLLEEAGVPVARIGLQPGQDIPHQAVAGPVHANLRGLVDGRRFRQRMAAALADTPPGSRATLRVHPGDLGAVKGTANEHLRAVRAELGLAELNVLPDPTLARGRVEVA